MRCGKLLLALSLVRTALCAANPIAKVQPVPLPELRTFAVAVPRAGKAPVLDGRISAGEYAKAATLTDWKVYILGTPMDDAVTAWLTYDDKNLYVSFRCLDDEIKASKEPPENFRPQKKGKADSYDGDLFELFLDPASSGATRYQICGNPIGMRYDEHPMKGVRWNGTWQCRGSWGDGFWDVEFQIPFKVLALEKAPDGRFWAANFVRAGRESLTWTGGWQGAADYGKLYFGPATEMSARMPVTARLALDRDVYSERDRSGQAVLVVERNGRKDLQARFAIRQENNNVWQGSAPLSERGAEVVFNVGGLESGDYVITASVIGNSGRAVASGSRAFRKDRVVRREAVAPPELRRVPLNVWACDAGPVGRWVVSTGIPFEQAMLDSPEQVRLLNPSGEEVPCQKIVRSRWTKGGSIRWLGLDFDAFLNKNGSQYAIEFGTQVRGVGVPEPVLKVNDAPDAVTIDTGRLRFLVRKRGFNLIDEVTLEGRAVLKQGAEGGPYLVDHEWNVYRTNLDPAPSVVIEERGPMKVVVRAEAWYVREGSKGERLSHELPTDKLCKSIVRVIAYAGKPYARIQHSWLVACDTNKVRFRNIGIELNVPAAMDFRVGTQKGYREGRLDGEAFDFSEKGHGVPGRPHKTRMRQAWLLQHSYEDYRIETGRKPGESWRRDIPAQGYYLYEQGERAPGWMSLYGKQGGVTVCVRDFWQTFPKELEAEPGALRVHVWPKHGIVPYYINPLAHQNIHQLWYAHSGSLLDMKMPLATVDAVRTIGGLYNGDYGDSGQYANGMGVSVTNELLLDFGTQEPSFERSAALASIFQDDPHALTAPEYNCSTDVLPLKLSPYQPKKYPWIEHWLADTFLGLVEAQKSTNDYGMFNYLDAHADNAHYMSEKLYGDRGPAWMLNRIWNAGHHGVSRLGWLLYFRSGDRRYLDYARPNTRHVLDVDVIHYHPKGLDLFAHVKGRNTRLLQHRQGAMYHCKGFTHWGGDSAVSGHLVNFDFGLWAYYLTGDRRPLDAVNTWLDALIEMGGYPCISREGIQMVGELPEFVQWRQAPALVDLLDRYAEVVFNVPLAEQGWYNYTQLLTRYWWFTRSRKALAEGIKVYEARGEKSNDVDWPATLYFATGDKKYLTNAFPVIEKLRAASPKPAEFPVKPELPERGTWYVYAYPAFWRMSYMFALDQAGVTLPEPERK